MRRREVIAIGGAAFGGAAFFLPRPGRAQQTGAGRKLAVLMVGAEADADSRPRIAGFRQGLQDHGWTEGENLQVDYRWSDGRPELIRRHAEEIVASKPDVIVANGTPAVATLKGLTKSIPIVCALVIDPVGLGLVESLSRPGGNITGFSFINVELIGKWAALLKEAAPGVTRAALLYNPKVNPWYVNFQKELAARPETPAVELISAPLETVEDIEKTIDGIATSPGGGLILGPDAFVIVHIGKIAQLAATHRLAAVSVYRQFAVEGGLMAYGPDVPDIFRRSAEYVDRILKGANPAELPVQQPIKFEFVVNQRTARALGVSLSATLLAGADDVIE